MSTNLFSLAGRRALVTGSARGIGAAIARTLADYGAAVAVHGRTERQAGERVAAACAQHGQPAVFIEADLAAPDGAAKTFRAAEAALGGVDILVINASYQSRRPWLELTPEEVDLHVAVNYRATLMLLQLAVPAMQQRRWGRIVTVGSVQERKPHPEMLAYSSLKAAQTALGLSLARSLAPSGITVNNLAPGVIDTDRNTAALQNQAYAQRILAGIPAGRIGQPDDCAAAALLFCSEAGAYITGQNLYVDGGFGLP